MAGKLSDPTSTRLAGGRPRSRMSDRLWNESGWRRRRLEMERPRDNFIALWKPIIICDR